MLKCSKCGEVNPVNKFSPAKQNKSGYRGECRQCESAYQKKYREGNKKKIVANYKKYYKANKKSLSEYQAEYYRTNKKKVINRVRKYRGFHLKEESEYARKWQNENRKKYQKRLREWQRKNRSQLGNSYVKMVLKKQTGIDHDLITDNVIEQFREHLILYRLIKQTRKEIKDGFIRRRIKRNSTDAAVLS